MSAVKDQRMSLIQCAVKTKRTRRVQDLFVKEYVYTEQWELTIHGSQNFVFSTSGRSLDYSTQQSPAPWACAKEFLNLAVTCIEKVSDSAVINLDILMCISRARAAKIRRIDGATRCQQPGGLSRGITHVLWLNMFRDVSVFGLRGQNLPGCWLCRRRYIWHLSLAPALSFLALLIRRRCTLS